MSFVVPGLPLKLANSLKGHLGRVENRLREITTGIDSDLDTRTFYLAKAGGKRLRPALVGLAGMILPGANPIDIESAAVLVELTHLASLYHDDVMDEAPRRRNSPSAHMVFGNKQAILAGDLLFARASEVAVYLGIEVVEIHSQTFARLCAGQLHETIGPRPDENPFDHHIQVLADKTGSLIAACARYGAMFCGLGKVEQEALSEYGEKIGVAFQIADDVIDLSADPVKTGKTPGTDLREGVSTMPVLLLREARKLGSLDAAGRNILDILESEDLGDDRVLAKTVSLIRAHPVVEETKELASRWAMDATSHLEILPDGDVKKALYTFAEQMVERVS